MANDKKRALFNIKRMIHEESSELFDRWSYVQDLYYSFLNHNQLVGVGTMAPLSKPALTTTEIGRVTGGTVDKTPTRNQEQ